MITKDGYATVPWGDRFVLIYNGYQLSDHKTYEQAVDALKKHRSMTRKPKTKTKSKAKLPLEN